MVIYFHACEHSVSVKPLAVGDNEYVWASDGAKIDLSLFRDTWWWFKGRGNFILNFLFTYLLLIQN